MSYSEHNFIIFPYLIIKLDINYFVLLSMALVGLIITILYAPAATKKQPIPRRLVKRKNTLHIFILYYRSYFISN